MHDLIVDADQHRPREAISQSRRGLRAVLLEDLRGHTIQFSCRDPRAHVPLERIEGQAYDLADAAEAFPVSFGFDGHGLVT